MKGALIGRTVLVPCCGDLIAICEPILQTTNKTVECPVCDKPLIVSGDNGVWYHVGEKVFMEG